MGALHLPEKGHLAPLAVAEPGVQEWPPSRHLKLAVVSILQEEMVLLLVLLNLSPQESQQQQQLLLLQEKLL
jgi:hypothetical protein